MSKQRIALSVVVEWADHYCTFIVDLEWVEVVTCIVPCRSALDTPAERIGKGAHAKRTPQWTTEFAMPSARMSIRSSINTPNICTFTRSGRRFEGV